MTCDILFVASIYYLHNEEEEKDDKNGLMH